MKVDFEKARRRMMEMLTDPDFKHVSFFAGRFHGKQQVIREYIEHERRKGVNVQVITAEDLPKLTKSTGVEIAFLGDEEA